MCRDTWVGVDMDGVTVNWLDAVCKYCGKDQANHPLGDYKATDRFLGRKWSDIKWELVPFWWAWLEKTPECDPLIAMIEELGFRYFFFSTPANGESAAGKIDWLRRHFNGVPYVFTWAKHILASENVILVDDNPENVEAFIAAGGQACLFPRRWNGLYEIEDQAVDVVKGFLQNAKVSVTR